MESQPQGLLGRANQCICGCFGHKVNTPNMAAVTTTEIISGPGSQTQSASRTQALGSAISGPGRHGPSLLPSADQLPSYKATCPCHGPYTVLGQNRQRWPCTEPSLKAHMCTHMHACTRTLGTAHMYAHVHTYMDTHAPTHTPPYPLLSPPPATLPSESPRRPPLPHPTASTCTVSAPQTLQSMNILGSPLTVTPLLIPPSNQGRQVLLFPF